MYQDAGVPRMQGYLTHKKQPSRRTLQQAYAYGPVAVLRAAAVSYQQGIPVEMYPHRGYVAGAPAGP